MASTVENPGQSVLLLPKKSHLVFTTLAVPRAKGGDWTSATGSVGTEASATRPEQGYRQRLEVAQEDQTTIRYHPEYSLHCFHYICRDVQGEETGRGRSRAPEGSWSGLLAKDEYKVAQSEWDTGVPVPHSLTYSYDENRRDLWPIPSLSNKKANMSAYSSI